MRSDEFWDDDLTTDSWNPVLNFPMLETLIRAPLPNRSDVEVAVGLARLLHDEFEEYGTSGKHGLTEEGSRLGLRALRAVTKRLAVSFDPPFADFSRFRSYWMREGASGSWQARREILDGLFEPLHATLDLRESQSIESTLVEPISPHRVTGWPRVDEEVAELRRHFEIATTAQDYRNVGNDCVTVLEAVSAAAYEHAVHGRAGENEPSVASTKDRLDQFVVVSMQGSENAPLRKLARAVIEMAQAVKHSPSGNRREAGIAADAVIQLANMLRRVQEPS